MLASISIEYLVNIFRNQQNVGVAYICCDYKLENEQRPLNLLANLLKQLLQQRSLIPDHVRKIYEQSDGAKISYPTLSEIFNSLQLTTASFSQVYIVVDALDELRQDDNVVKALLSDLSELQAKRVVNLMLTSRYIPRVVYYVQSDMTLEVRASDEDVKRYVDGRINELPKFIPKDRNYSNQLRMLLCQRWMVCRFTPNICVIRT